MSGNTKVMLTDFNRRGKNFQIKISISSMICGEVMSMDPINLADMCLLRFKFSLEKLEMNDNNCKLMVRISFKKHENADKSLIAINISHRDFEDECIVGKYYTLYLPIGPGIETKEVCYNKVTHELFMSIKVNIKVYDTIAKPLLVNQRLYEDATFTDFNLKAEDGMVAVHKAVLSTQSEVFQAMLNREWSETTEGTFSMNGGSVYMQTLLAFKDYMYLQTLPGDLTQLQNLLQIASCYMIDNLKTECISRIVDLVTPENFDGVVEFVCLNNAQDLMKAIVINIPEEVVKSIQDKENNVQEKNDNKKV